MAQLSTLGGSTLTINHQEKEPATMTIWKRLFGGGIKSETGSKIRDRKLDFRTSLNALVIQPEDQQRAKAGTEMAKGGMACCDGSKLESMTLEEAVAFMDEELINYPIEWNLDNRASVGFAVWDIRHPGGDLSALSMMTRSNSSFYKWTLYRCASDKYIRSRVWEAP